MKVKECMCDDVCCVKPETKIKEVAKLMSENHIGSIPVCDQNQCICGIVTDRDILLRCVACDKDTNQTSVVGILTLGDLAQNTQSIGQQQVNETIENICNCHQNKNAE